jgi:glycosyltransferase involved in cell wall biosynthesis
MAHGVPVAAFALGGLPEMIEHAVSGYLAPPDVAALAACVSQWQALHQDQRNAMAKAAWQVVFARYGRAAGVAAIQQAYRPALPQ